MAESGIYRTPALEGWQRTNVIAAANCLREQIAAGAGRYQASQRLRRAARSARPLAPARAEAAARSRPRPPATRRPRSRPSAAPPSAAPPSAARPTPERPAASERRTVGAADQGSPQSLMARAVLFDLDDTLFDHRRSARAALTELHRVHGRGTDLDAFERHHTKYPRSHAPRGARRAHRARRRAARAVPARVPRASASRSDEADVDAVASAYRARLHVGAPRRSTAPPISCVARAPARAHRHRHQQPARGTAATSSRTAASPPLVDVLIASEDVGVSKPDRGIFDIALQRIGVDRGRGGDGRRLLGERHRRRGGRRDPRGLVQPGSQAAPGAPAGVAEIHALAPRGATLLLGPLAADAVASGGEDVVSLRIGIDLGGTKIEAIGLGAGRRRARSAAASTRRAAATTARCARSRTWSARPSVGRCARHGRRRHARRHLAGDRPRQERELHLADRPSAAAGSRARCSTVPVRLANDANCFALSEAERRRGRRRARGVRRDPRHRGRRRDRRGRPGARRRERDRGGVGPQHAAVARRGRVARAAVLLRPHRVHRDVPVRARTGTGLRRRRARRARDCRRGRRAIPRASAAVDLYARRLAKALAGVINIARSRRRSCSAAGSPTSRRSTVACPSCGRSGSSPTASTRVSRARSTATRAV